MSNRQAKEGRGLAPALVIGASLLAGILVGRFLAAAGASRSARGTTEAELRDVAKTLRHLENAVEQLGVTVEAIDQADPVAGTELSAPEERAGKHVAVDSRPIDDASDTPEGLKDTVARLDDALDRMVSLLSSPGARAGTNLAAAIPTREQIDAAPQQNWMRLQALINDYAAGPESKRQLIERLRWRSQDEILAQYGRPTRISDQGFWDYERRNRLPGELDQVFFYFVGDYVMNVKVL